MKKLYKKLDKAKIKINKASNNTKIINAIEKAYLRSKKRSQAFQSFRLFSLDASDLNVLENIETQNGESDESTLKIDSIRSNIRTQEQAYSNIRSTLKLVEDAIEEAKKTKNIESLAIARQLLSTIITTKETIIEEIKNLKSNINALYKMDINDD